MTKIHEYFLAEKNESLAFIVIGTAAIVCGFYFWLAINQSFVNGLGWPLLFVALIQLSVGSYLYFSSPQKEHRIITATKSSPKNIKNVEIPRMEKVMAKFKYYRYIEMGLLVIGLIAFLLSSKEGFWRGVGLGLVIQGGIMLIADSFAENRGQTYLEFLKETFG
ncbi:MAG: hypothetical protein ACKVQB_12130 [Bacteroidia bacterium]